MVREAYIFIKSNLFSYKNWKQNLEISNIALILLLWVKVIFLTNTPADIWKIKEVLVQKGAEATYVLLLTNQISSF